MSTIAFLCLAAMSGAPDVVVAPEVAVAPAGRLDEVRFEGRVYFKDETLRTFMRSVIGEEAKAATLELDRATFEQRYRERGFLRAEVALSMEQGALLGQSIAVFKIAAGDRAELKTISVNGNRVVEESALKEGFFSRPPEPLGGLTRAGFFHKPFLDQDGQRLVANYYRRGHLEARVTRTRVKAYPGLDGIEVVMDVIEGAVYELAGLELTGDLPEADPAELRSRVSVADGEIADLVTVQQQADGLLDPLREDGHAFARFEQAIRLAPPPSGRTDRKAVVVTLRGVKGPQTTVRKIRLVGNKGTQDHVIRRDVVIEEGGLYRHSALLLTQRRLMGTGYFQQVTVRPIPATEAGEVDIEVRVREQPTFLFNIVPVVTANEVIGVALLADRNLFGTGLFASFTGQLSNLRQLFDISLTEPRLLDTRTSLTAEVHRRELIYRGYTIRSEAGGGVRVGVPLGGGFVAGGGATVEYTGVSLFGSEGPTPDSVDLLPDTRFRNVLNASIAWDRRDSVLAPRNGAYARVSASYAGFLTLSGIDALEGGLNLRLFWTPLWDITVKTNTQIGVVINPTGGAAPVTDRFFLGGFGSVRGYFPRSIGPRRTLELASGPLVIDEGGNRMFAQNLELEFPVWPGTPLRGFLFGDVGQAWSEREAILTPVTREGAGALPLGLFSSVGFGFLIENPVFPFRFQWSVPLNVREGLDQPFDFFLGIGSAF